MKKILGMLLISISILGISGCNNENPSDNDNTTEAPSTVESDEQGVEFTKSFYTANASKQAELKGTANQDGALTYIDSNGKEKSINISSNEGFTINYDMSNLDETEVTFTFTSSDGENFYYDIKIIPNNVDDVETTEFSTPEAPTFTAKIGETIDFSSSAGQPFSLTIDTIGLGETDDYYQPVNGRYLKVDFTVENTGSSELYVSAAEFQVYDGNDLKGEVASKDYFIENIAAGKKAVGSVYLDTSETGPYEIMFGDISWEYSG